MRSPTRQSPRAAIREWLAHAEQSPVEEKQNPRPQERGGRRKKDQDRSLKHLHSESREGPGPTGEVRQDPKAQTRVPFQESRRDAPNKTTSGRNVADQLGLHAPFRSFATLDADADPGSRPDHERRKRQRTASSTSSYLEPATCFRKDIERPSVHGNAQARRERHHRQHESIGTSSLSSATIASPTKPTKKYERRPRHKTREDRYELKENNNKRSKIKEGEMVVQRKAKKSKRRKKKTGAALMHDFSANNIESERLTLKAPIPLGLFGKGRASSPFRRRGLPDLTFSELNFLNKRKEGPKENAPPSKQSRRKRDKAADAEAEISRFFTSSKDCNHEAGGTADPRKSANRERRAAQQHESSIPPVELPEKAFLGFGSCGPGHVSSIVLDDNLIHQSPLRNPPSSRSTTYFTWSQTDLSERSLSRHRSKPQPPSSEDQLEPFPISNPPARGQMPTSSTTIDRKVREESGAISSAHSDKTKHAKIRHDASGSLLRPDNSVARRELEVDAKGSCKRQNKVHKTEQQGSPRSQRVSSPKAALASVQAVHSRPALLGVVLDALLGKGIDKTEKYNGSRPSGTRCSKGQEDAPVPEAFSKSLMPHEVSRSDAPKLMPLSPNIVNEPVVAAEPYVAHKFHQSQPSHIATPRSPVIPPPSASYMRPPLQPAHDSPGFREKQGSHRHDTDDVQMTLAALTPSVSNNAWTGYRNLYQGQMGSNEVYNQFHDVIIENNAGGIHHNFDHPLDTTEEAHEHGSVVDHDRYHTFEAYEQPHAEVYHQDFSAGGVHPWNHTEPHLYEQMDVLDQVSQEEVLNNNRHGQGRGFFGATAPALEHAENIATRQDFGGGAETPHGLETPKFLGSRGLTERERNESFSPWSSRRSMRAYPIPTSTGNMGAINESPPSGFWRPNRLY